MEVYYYKALLNTDPPNIATEIKALNFNKYRSDSLISLIILCQKDNV